MCSPKKISDVGTKYTDLSNYVLNSNRHRYVGQLSTPSGFTNHPSFFLFSKQSSPSSHTQYGRPGEISTPRSPVRHRGTLPHQGVHPLHASPHKPNTHQPRLGAAISLRPRRNTMGRTDTSAAEATAMVQMRESAESGGVQGAGCLPCAEEVDGGGGMGRGRWEGEGCCDA